MNYRLMPQRTNESFSQSLEQPALLWMAQRMPHWVTPDILTGIGFLGACIAAAGYALSVWQFELLWLAIAGISVNWFGDSLDGTLARVRKIERPRYGFFLDQSLDAVEQLMVSIAIGFSELVRFEIAMLAISMYFLLSIISLVKAVVSNQFTMTYGGFGLTELRVVLIVLIPVMYFYPPMPFPIANLSLSYMDLLTLAWAGMMAVTFVLVMTAQLRRLAAEEPKS